ncbi:hypothetical protein HanPI659440_Chr03g0098001 [Helianthus annuus]|nr:hypothetical protein HanPI659440_Chr03g0098001 [Helianthus annuus]
MWGIRKVYKEVHVTVHCVQLLKLAINSTSGLDYFHNNSTKVPRGVKYDGGWKFDSTRIAGPSCMTFHQILILMEISKYCSKKSKK